MLPIEGFRATRYIFEYLEKNAKTDFWRFSKYVDFSFTHDQNMLGNIEFKRFCNDCIALSKRHLIEATRDLTSNFIKACIQKFTAYGISILEKCMILCGELISYG